MKLLKMILILNLRQLQFDTLLHRAAGQRVRSVFARSRNNMCTTTTASYFESLYTTAYYKLW